MKDEKGLENNKETKNIHINNPNKIKDLETKIVKKVKNFSYLINNNLMYFCFKLSSTNDIEIKLN